MEKMHRNHFPTEEEVRKIREAYPVGTTIELLSMSDPYAPIESGTIGVVKEVDDMGTLRMSWSNGRSLGVVLSEDKVKIISKPEGLEKEEVAKECQRKDSKENLGHETQEEIEQDFTEETPTMEMGGM